PYGIPPGSVQNMGGGWPGGSQSFGIGGGGGPGLYQRPGPFGQGVPGEGAHHPGSLPQTFPVCPAPPAQEARWGTPAKPPGGGARPRSLDSPSRGGQLKS